MKHKRDATAATGALRHLPARLHALGTVALAAAVIVPLALYAITMPPTITWWFGGADSGELVAAAEAFGVAHPSGYPLFVLLGFLATRLPWGEAAARVNALNALLAAFGAGVLALTAATLTAGLPGGQTAARAAGALAAVGVALTPLYWSQAIIGEVYALQALLTAIVLYVWARPGVPPGLRGLAHGLALTNHLTALLLLVAALAAFARPRGRAWQRSALEFLAGLLLPLALYALLPLRAAADPPANWGDPDNLSRFLDHVSGRDYRGNIAWTDPAGALRDLAAYLRLLAGELWWLLPFAAAGLSYLWRGRRDYAWFTLLTAAGTLLFVALYRTPDRAPYLLPVYAVLAVWAGPGLLVAARFLAGHAGPRARDALRWAAPTVLLLLLGLSAARTYRRVDLSGDDSATVFARLTLERLPPDAVYQSARDDVTFALWYAQRTLGLRRDVRVVDVRNPELRGLP